MTGDVKLPTLPELVTVGCPECQEEGCETCAGTGKVEVCGGCGGAPDVATDACACTLTVTASTVLCETCDCPTNAATLTDGICPTCFAEGAATIQREAEEHAAFVAEQLALGHDYGWLP
jgi:hypothetical protein